MAEWSKALASGLLKVHASSKEQGFESLSFHMFLTLPGLLGAFLVWCLLDPMYRSNA